MRLRSVIKPPKRYEDEIESSVDREPQESRESRYSRRRAVLTNYVDFDPTLPPAAFPTLDHPQPLGEQNCSEVKKEEEEDYDAGVYKLPNTEREEENNGDGLSLVDYSHVPLQDFDNFVASNGPQNSQYAENMAILSQTSFSSLSISDDDESGESPVPEAIPEEPLMEDPKWGDLSLGLQIEIADNMLQHNHIAKIQNVLGLSNQEAKDLVTNLNKRDQDIEYENRVLAEMRAKQLQALMVLDNSELQKYSVPEKLIMSRKSWARCHNVVKKNSKMKYLLCKVGDLRLARKFLSKRGLPLSLAGDWDNDYVATPTISDHVDESFTFNWKDPEKHQEVMSNIPSDGTTAPGFQPGVPTAINPKVLSSQPMGCPTQNQKPQSSTQQGQNKSAESSAAASRRGMQSLKPGCWTEMSSGLQTIPHQLDPLAYTYLNDLVEDKGKGEGIAQDTGREMPQHIPGSFSSEEASDLPLLRRLSAWPTSTIIQQQWQIPSMQPDDAIMGEQEALAAMPHVDIQGQVTAEQSRWDMGLTEFHAAAKTVTTMTQLPGDMPSSAMRSVLNDRDTDVDIEEEERQLEDTMLTFIDIEAYAREPEQSNYTPSQENPWGRLLKGVGTWAAPGVVTETVEQGSLETPQRQLSMVSAGQRYVTPATQSSPVPADEGKQTTKKGKERVTPSPANTEGPTTPPPTVLENRQLRSWNRRRLSSDLGVESPTDKRLKSTDTSTGGHNLRARPIRPAKKK
ncbi:hypothetical protein PISL3812_06697 [Talaromyces islandicus]|uniref:Uncharacterized protein n=1 Tax=Talaromyces islandicus TaxID=28573 RepID=A0A0U1M254_TALIS|nr:hypothetical protein PISL3812_06697 [Talaromyces islandicus]